MYKLVFFVPTDDAEQVVEAMFMAGAGKIGNYDKCCFMSKGIGQYRPLEGSQPHLGKHNQLEKVEEMKVEMVCEKGLIEEVVAAMKRAHPYEVPAYDVIKLEEIK